MVAIAKPTIEVPKAKPIEGALPNLYQRLAAVQGVIEDVRATGRNAQGGRALSIGDVEDAIAEALAKAGVVTRWTRTHMESYSEATRNGRMTMWRIDLRVTVVNADDPEDRFEDEWSEIGNSPAAAYSFARKSYYKALLHIAEDNDEAPPADRGVRQPAQRPSGRNVAAPVAGATLEPGERDFQAGDDCAMCLSLANDDTYNADVRVGKYQVAKGGPMKGQLQCTGKVDGQFVNHPAPLNSVDRKRVEDLGDQEIPL